MQTETFIFFFQKQKESPSLNQITWKFLNYEKDNGRILEYSNQALFFTEDNNQADKNLLCVRASSQRQAWLRALSISFFDKIPEELDESQRLAITAIVAKQQHFWATDNTYTIIPRNVKFHYFLTLLILLSLVVVAQFLLGAGGWVTCLFLLIPALAYHLKIARLGLIAVLTVSLTLVSVFCVADLLHLYAAPLSLKNIPILDNTLGILFFLLFSIYVILIRINKAQN